MKRLALLSALFVLVGCRGVGPDGKARFDPASAAAATEATTAAFAPFSGPVAPIVITVGSLVAALLRARAKKDESSTPTNGGTT